MTADVNIGLVIEDDAFSFINPGIDFAHDEVLVKVTRFGIAIPSIVGP